MSVKERLKEFISSKKMSVRAFEKACDLSYGYVNNMRVSIQPSKITNIATQFPELNTGWLLTGEGEMLKTSENKTEESENRENVTPVHIAEISVTIAPLIGQYAQAGYLNGYADKEYLERQPMYYAIKKYSGGNYIAFEVRGDSMDNDKRNAICSGDIILGRELYKDYWLSKLHIPRIFIIVHEEGICVKEVIDHDVEGGIITCHSYNPDKTRYPDFQVNLREVRQLFYMKELRRDND